MLHINLALIGQAVLEEKIFENGGRRRRRTDDGWTPDHGHPISSPCEPYGSGELKTFMTNLSLAMICLYHKSCCNELYSLAKDLEIRLLEFHFRKYFFLQTLWPVYRGGCASNRLRCTNKMSFFILVLDFQRLSRMSNTTPSSSPARPCS